MQYFQKEQGKGKNIFRLIQWSTIFVFLGRAWQHLYYDAPWRSLLWDEELMSPLFNMIGIPWEDWIGNTSNDMAISSGIKGVGVYLIISALATLLIKVIPKISRVIVFVGGIYLVILSLLYFKAKFFFPAQLFEYSIHSAVPFFLLALVRKEKVTSSLLILMKVSIAFTFISHGLYALNVYPRPANFMEMTMNILHVNETGAIHFLRTAAILDFITSIAIFIPVKKVNKTALLYMAIWGLLTALARPIAYFYPDFWLQSLHEQIFQAVYRLAHALVPLAVWLYYKQNTNLQL